MVRAVVMAAFAATIGTALAATGPAKRAPGSSGTGGAPTGPVNSAAGRKTLVICAPGFPGTTVEAQPTMDRFAAAAERAAAWPAGTLGAAYHETEKAGLDRLVEPDACLALVPLPFFVEHGAALDLRPRLEVAQESGSTEVWSLVAKRGKVASPASLAGWEITGVVGYAKSFVLGPLMEGWGRPPADVRVTFGVRTLAALRRASAGENLAVVLDRAGVEGLAALPFAADLQVVARSKPLPASLLCTVRNRLAEDEAAALFNGLVRLHERPEGAEILKTMRMVRFEPADAAALKSIGRARTAAAASAK